MDKTRTSIRRRASSKTISKPSNRTLKDHPKLIEFDPTAHLLDQDFIASAVWECLKTGDADGVLEVISIHLETYEKMKKNKSPISKTTRYQRWKRENPSLESLAKIVKKVYQPSQE